MLFYSGRNQNVNNIIRCSLEINSNIEEFRQFVLSRPGDSILIFTIDKKERRIYFLHDGEITSTDYNGGTSATIVQENQMILSHLTNMNIYENDIIWYNRKDYTVWCINKATGLKIRALFSMREDFEFTVFEKRLADITCKFSLYYRGRHRNLFFTK